MLFCFFKITHPILHQGLDQVRLGRRVIGSCYDDGNAAVGALVLRLVGEDEGMQLTDKKLGHRIAGGNEFFQETECVPVSDSFHVILQGLSAHRHAGKHHGGLAQS